MSSGGVCPFASVIRSSTPENNDDTTQPLQQAMTCPWSGVGSSLDNTTGKTAADSRGATACPLGFGSRPSNRTSSSSFDHLPRMPLVVLRGHRSGQVRLLSIKGVVFDVSDDKAFHALGGGQLSRLPGHDASRFLAKFTLPATAGDNGVSVPTGALADAISSGNDYGSSDGNFYHDDELDAGLEGLRYEDHQRLESCFERMAKGRRAVAVLTDEDHARIFGIPFGGAGRGPPKDTQSIYVKSDYSRGLATITTRTVTDRAAELHSLVERGDPDAVKFFLANLDGANTSNGKLVAGETSTSGNDEALVEDDSTIAKNLLVVDARCARTGMTPLLKAVEGAYEGIVAVLLEAGADVRSQAALYDDDDALKLAKRLGERDNIVEMLLPHYSAP